jgi:hypothetical protein
VGGARLQPKAHPIANAGAIEKAAGVAWFWLPFLDL